MHQMKNDYRAAALRFSEIILEDRLRSTGHPEMEPSLKQLLNCVDLGVELAERWGEKIAEKDG